MAFSLCLNWHRLHGLLYLKAKPVNGCDPQMRMASGLGMALAGKQQGKMSLNVAYCNAKGQPYYRFPREGQCTS